MDDCVFCKIVSNEALSHKIWEDENHLAFLSIYPNTKGFTVVIPKKHVESYAFNAVDEILVDLVLASKKVARILDDYYEDVGRTGLIFEGFGVNHLHAKLFPMHGTNTREWKQMKSTENKYFERYEGYISSHDSNRADDIELAKLAEEIQAYSD